MKRQDITIVDCATSEQANRIINGEPFNDDNELVLITRKELKEAFWAENPVGNKSHLAKVCAEVSEWIDKTCVREEHIEELLEAIEFDRLFSFAHKELPEQRNSVGKIAL